MSSLPDNTGKLANKTDVPNTDKTMKLEQETIILQNINEAITSRSEKPIKSNPWTA